MFFIIFVENCYCSMAKVSFLLSHFIIASVCDCFHICLLEKDENYQSLHDEHDKLLCKFDELSSKYKMLKSDFKQLTDVKAATAEKLRQLEIENKRLSIRKKTFTTATTNNYSKFTAQANNIPPRNVDSVSSAPCPTCSVLHALSEEGNREYRKNEDEDDYEEGGSYEDEHSENDTDEESTQKATDAEQKFFCFARDRWKETKRLCQNTLKDIDSGNKRADEVLKDRRKFLEISDELKQPCEFLTFYVGNLHFAANTYQIKKAVENATGMPVDQVVVAKTSSGESRGCAFVTVRWRDFICITYDCSDRLKQMMKIDGIKYHLKYGSNIWTNAFCSIMSHERIRGRRISVELARSQRRN